MKELTEASLQTSLSKARETPTTESLPLSYISKIFRIMKAEYGTAFTSNFRTADELNEAKARWAQKLFNVAPEQIKHGLETMGDSHKQFPPKLNEFIEICHSMTPNVHRAHQLYISQNVTKAKPEVGKTFRQKIKEESGI